MSVFDDDFYGALPQLDNFRQLLKPQNYVSVPGNWYVLVTDVVGSTQAIEAGKYKQVNFLGAGSIMAVLNALRPTDIPFVFGGDGASLLVPPSLLQPARSALLGMRQMAKTRFQMDLRVGVVPVAVIQDRYPLQIAKVHLTGQSCQASFIGGGLTYATDLVKSDETYRLDVDTTDAKADLTSLECRWQDVFSLHGHTVSLLVAPTGEPQTRFNAQVFVRVLEAIEAIYGGARQYRPVVASALKLSFNPKQLALEVKARSTSGKLWPRATYLSRMMLEDLLGLMLMELNLTPKWGRYKEDVAVATDYQKIDDIMRMVISGTPKQTQQLHKFLERQFQAGRLAYGTHISDRALMTCMIFERHNHHIHLVDGADGGYAIAAKSLKARLQQLSNSA